MQAAARVGGRPGARRHGCRTRTGEGIRDHGDRSSAVSALERVDCLVAGREWGPLQFMLRQPDALARVSGKAVEELPSGSPLVVLLAGFTIIVLLSQPAIGIDVGKQTHARKT